VNQPHLTISPEPNEESAAYSRRIKKLILANRVLKSETEERREYGIIAARIIAFAIDMGIYNLEDRGKETADPIRSGCNGLLDVVEEISEALQETESLSRAAMYSQLGQSTRNLWRSIKSQLELPEKASYDEVLKASSGEPDFAKFLEAVHQLKDESKQHSNRTVAQERRAIMAARKKNALLEGGLS
jgi:hypothetical protein